MYKKVSCVLRCLPQALSMALGPQERGGMQTCSLKEDSVWPLSALRSGTGHRQAVHGGAGCYLPPPAMERHSFPAHRGCLALLLVLKKCVPRGQKERGGNIIQFGVNTPCWVRGPLLPLFVGLELISYLLLRGHALGSKGKE